MVSLNGFKSKNIIIIFFYYILLSIKNVFADELIDMKKLFSSNSYFVVLDTGLYLYNINTNFDILDCAIIYKFEKTITFLVDKVFLSELNNDNKAFILCLINNDLYIFNEYTNKTINYTLNEIKKPKTNYYNIMPYKLLNNNISFIIGFHKDSKNLIFYFYNFDLNGDINKPNEIKFNTINNIEDKMISCQINSYSTFIKCFYYSKIEEQKHLSYIKFSIENIHIEKNLDDLII